MENEPSASSGKCPILKLSRRCYTIRAGHKAIPSNQPDTTQATRLSNWGPHEWSNPKPKPKTKKKKTHTHTHK